jgi:hypothetical protein
MNQAIQAKITAAQLHLSSLKESLEDAETLKVNSFSDESLSWRHSLDRSRVEYLNSAITCAEHGLALAKLEGAHDESRIAANALHSAYMTECKRVEKRDA